MGFYQKHLSRQNLILLSCCLLFSGLVSGHDGLSGQLHRLNHQLKHTLVSADFYIQRGELYRQNSHWHDALNDFEQAQKLAPDNSQIDFYLAKTRYDLGNFAMALISINHYLLHNHNAINGLILKARILNKQHDFAVAAQFYAKAVDESQRLSKRPMPDWYIEQASALANNQALKAAVAVMDSGSEVLGPLRVFQLKAVEYERTMAAYPGALIRVEQLLARAKRKDLLLALKGDIQYQAKQFKQAQQSYMQAAELLAILPLRLRLTSENKKNRQYLDRQLKLLQSGPGM
jgi:tetratricopeptide (TPR) repeat protein